MAKQRIRHTWRILSKYIGNSRRELVLISIVGVVSAAANGAAPLLVGRFIDAILEPSSVELWQFTIALWVFLVALWFSIQIIAAVADWFVSLRGDRMADNLYVSYMSQGFETLLHLPLSFHKRKQTGDITSNVQRGGNYLARMVHELASIGPQLLSIFFGIGIALYISVWASLPLIAGVGMYLLLLRRNFGRAYHMRRKQWDKFSDAFGVSYDMVNNVESVKHFTAENYASKLFTRKFHNAFRWAYQGIVIWSRVGFQQKMLVAIVQLSVFTISVLLIQAGTMTVGELIALNGYAAMFFGPFVALGRRLDFFQEAAVGLRKAESILTSKREAYTPHRSVRPNEIRGEIEFDNVYFRYKSKDEPVLENINLHIRPGQTLALVGESGVGKSTLVDLIGGFYFPSRGNVRIDGRNIRRIDLEYLRRYISYVPQEILLFHETIYNNIRFAKPEATKAEIEEAARRAKADEFIEKFPQGYNTVVGKRGVKLSAGQRQRIAIARVILRDPRVLILDEPTSALDAKTEKSLTDSLEELMEGRTTIIIAHRLSTVRRADVIATIKNGQVMEMGSHDELLAKEAGIYRELHGLQFDMND